MPIPHAGTSERVCPRCLALVGIGQARTVELEVRRDDEHVTADLLRSGEVMAAVTTEPAQSTRWPVRLTRAGTFSAAR